MSAACTAASAATDLLASNSAGQWTDIPGKGITFASPETGVIMDDPITVYGIFYGTWSSSQMTLAETVVNSLSDSSMAQQTSSLYQWWNILQIYYNPRTENHLTGNITWGVSDARSTSALLLHLFVTDTVLSCLLLVARQANANDFAVPYSKILHHVLKMA